MTDMKRAASEFVAPILGSPETIKIGIEALAIYIYFGGRTCIQYTTTEDPPSPFFEMSSAHTSVGMSCRLLEVSEKSLKSVC